MSLEALIKEREEIRNRIESSCLAHEGVVAQCTERWMHLEARIAAQEAESARRVAAQEAAAKKVAEAAVRHAAGAAAPDGSKLSTSKR